jgi:hypothetical protein
MAAKKKIAKDLDDDLPMSVVSAPFDRQARNADMTQNFNRLIESLVLVRLGQELGTDSDLAQSIAHSLDFAIAIAGRLFC